MDGDFQPGIYVLLGEELATLSLLLELTLGHSPPQRGEVRVAGAEPCRDPATRRRIGSLLWQEELPEAKRVLLSVQSLLELHGEKAELAAGALRQLGLQTLADRHPHALSSDERRGVALAVALALNQPLLLSLASPLSVRCIDRQAVLTLLKARSKQAVVLIVTTDAAEAADIDGLCLLFAAGRIISRVARPGAASNATASLSVISSDSARLARLLAGEPAVVRLEAPLEGETLVVHGQELASLSRTLLRLAHEQDIDLLSLSQRVPLPHEFWNQPRSVRTTPLAPAPAPAATQTTPLAPAPTATRTTPLAPAPAATRTTPLAPAPTANVGEASGSATPASDSAVRSNPGAERATQDDND